MGLRSLLSALWDWLFGPSSIEDRPDDDDSDDTVVVNDEGSLTSVDTKLVDPKPDVPEPVGDYPNVFEVTKFDNEPIVEITVHATKKLREKNGYISDEMAAYYIMHAIREAGFNCKIYFGFPAVDAPQERALCGPGSVFGWWFRQVHRGKVERAKDANILLTNANGTGCGSTGGKVSTAGGHNISEMRPWEPTGEGSFHYNIHSVLHEIAHNLGMLHDHDKDTPGKQSLGMAWNDDETETWHRTPSYKGNFDRNYCGEETESREYTRVIRHQTFWDCAVKHFEIVDPNT